MRCAALATRVNSASGVSDGAFDRTPSRRPRAFSAASPASVSENATQFLAPLVNRVKIRIVGASCGGHRKSRFQRYSFQLQVDQRFFHVFDRIVHLTFLRYRDARKTGEQFRIFQDKLGDVFRLGTGRLVGHTAPPDYGMLYRGGRQLIEKPLQGPTLDGFCHWPNPGSRPVWRLKA